MSKIASESLHDNYCDNASKSMKKSVHVGECIGEWVGVLELHNFEVLA